MGYAVDDPSDDKIRRTENTGIHRIQGSVGQTLSDLTDDTGRLSESRS